jgi:CO/xanthine dehydrogenase Mo-binding subunit
VKYVDDRLEVILVGNQAWDRHYEASVALKRDGTITGLQVMLVDDMGATGEGVSAFQPLKPLACFTGCYAIPVAGYHLTMVATNKMPRSVYRCAGPPPHYFVLEQMVDIAARGIGMDPAEIRRKNYIQPEQFPYIIPSGNEYDSGNYELALDTVLEMADYPQLRQEQAKARAAGRLFGIGVANVIEPGVFDFNNYADAGMPLIGIPEGATIAMDMAGGVTVQLGHKPTGQRQWSTATMVVADYFGIPMESVRIVLMDTLSAPPNFGPGGSRCGVAMTGGLIGACTLLKEKLIKVAAHLLKAPRENVELMDGMLRIKGMPQAALPMTQVVATMLCRSDLLPPDVDMNPTATYAWTAEGRLPPDEMGRCKSYLTAANACHVAVVEIDAETGKVKILKYFVADDCGIRLNPTSVEAMTDGGIGQGVGAALFEEFLYDDNAQPLTITFMDYLLPTIHDVPANQKKALVTPSPVAPLGAKGCGEGALHITPAVIMNAVNDALVPLGVRATETPASPRRLWQLIQEARKARKPGADGKN